MSTTETVDVMIADAPEEPDSYMEWGPVLAGAVVASAISLVLFTFGGGVGLSISSPFPNENTPPQTLSYLTMGWVLVVMIFSFIAGGYLAGRLRKPAEGATPDAVDFRDGAHGLVVWAVGLLIGAAVSMMTAGTVASSFAGSPNSMFESEASIILRGGDDIQPNDRHALAAILANATVDGALEEPDRRVAAEIVSDRTDLTEAEANARLSEWEGRNIERVDRSRAVGAIGAFLLAASALVAGAGAYFAAGIGGRHRDLNSPFPWTRARAKN